MFLFPGVDVCEGSSCELRGLGSGAILVGDTEMSGLEDQEQQLLCWNL